jgi:hypothetical protein
MSLRRRTVLIGLAVALVLFVAFEVGVRQITPDAVSYEIVTVNPVGPGRTQSGAITEPATIAKWRSAMTAQPGKRLSDAYFTAWWGTGCAFGTTVSGTVRFTWHGLPVEVASPAPGCAFMSSVLSSGGLPAPQIYYVDFEALLKG